MEFGFRLRTGHCLVQGIRAEVNAAGPFYATGIRTHRDRVEVARLQQLQEDTTPAMQALLQPFKLKLWRTARRTMRQATRAFRPSAWLAEVPG